jgi:hypothetical protein
MCNWLLYDQHDAESLGRFVEHEDRFLATSHVGNDRIGISLLLPTYVDAGAYRRAMELFATTPGLSVPKSLNSIRNEAQMCYIICCRELNQEYAKEKITSALSRFLTRNMDDWLSNGHFVRAAEWMKIVYWRDRNSEVSPKIALLKCYDHLPGCNHPS